MSRRRVLLHELKRFQSPDGFQRIDCRRTDHVLPDLRSHHLFREWERSILLEEDVRREGSTADKETRIHARDFTEADVHVSGGSSAQRQPTERGHAFLADASIWIASRGHESGGDVPHRRDRSPAWVASPDTDRIYGTSTHRPEFIVARRASEGDEGSLVGGPLRQQIDRLDPSENVVVVHQLVAQHRGGTREIREIEDPVSLVPANRAGRSLEIRPGFSGSISNRHHEADDAAVGARFDIDVDIEEAGETVARLNLSRADHAVSYTHLRAHETRHDLVCRLLLE